MGNWRPWDGKLPDARRQFVDDSDSDFGSESESTVTQWSYISSSSDGGNATAIVNVEAMGSPHPENGLQFVKVTFNDGSTDIQQSQEFNDLLNDWNDASEGNAITQPPNSDVTSAAPVESESDEEDSELLTREEDERLTAAQGGKEETQESREAWARQQESFEESKKNGQNLIQEESEESESAPENVGDEIRLAEENPDVGEKSDLEYEFSEGKEVAPGEQSSPALEELDVVDGPGEKAFQLSEKGWGRGLLEAWIIQETVAVLTVMTLLDGFGDEKGKKFAAGAAQFDRVAEELAKAVAGQGWQGVAAQAYATRNSEVHWVALQMADADKRMRRLLERHGEQVTETREVLGTFTAFLGTVCMAVAVGLAKMGRYEASLIFQISVCSAALGACGGAQGKLIAHSKKTAAGVDGAISSYQRLAAQLRSGARGFGLPHGGDKGWVIDAGGGPVGAAVAGPATAARSWARPRRCPVRWWRLSAMPRPRPGRPLMRTLRKPRCQQPRRRVGRRRRRPPDRAATQQPAHRRGRRRRATPSSVGVVAARCHRDSTVTVHPPGRPGRSSAPSCRGGPHRVAAAPWW
ncbi:hypothetical protein I546_3256 [Mycobacterium kansasii 732]|nr:hypothetical protein I546_3256 [Mycobacterium kansasii 732]